MRRLAASVVTAALLASACGFTTPSGPEVSSCRADAAGDAVVTFNDAVTVRHPRPMRWYVDDKNIRTDESRIQTVGYGRNLAESGSVGVRVKEALYPRHTGRDLAREGGSGVANAMWRDVDFRAIRVCGFAGTTRTLERISTVDRRNPTRMDAAHIHRVVSRVIQAFEVTSKGTLYIVTVDVNTDTDSEEIRSHVRRILANLEIVSHD